MHETLRRVAARSALYTTVRQAQLHALVNEKLGQSHSYELDFARHHFAFTSEQGQVRARPHMVASNAVEPHTYLWSYAEQFRPVREYSAVPGELEAFAQQHKLPDFAPHAHPYEVEGEDQHASMRNVGHLLGQAAIEATRRADHFYYFTREPQLGGLYVVLLEGIEGAPGQLCVEDVVPHLSTLLGAVTDVDWEVGGFADLAGWRFVRSDRRGEFPRWKATDQHGHHILIEVVENAETGRQSLAVDIDVTPL